MHLSWWETRHGSLALKMHGCNINTFLEVTLQNRTKTRLIFMVAELCSATCAAERDMLSDLTVCISPPCGVVPRMPYSKGQGQGVRGAKAYHLDLAPGIACQASGVRHLVPDICCQ